MSICIDCLIRTWLIGLEAHLIVDCRPISLLSQRVYSFIRRRSQSTGAPPPPAPLHRQRPAPASPAATPSPSAAQPHQHHGVQNQHHAASTKLQRKLRPMPLSNLCSTTTSRIEIAVCMLSMVRCASERHPNSIVSSSSNRRCAASGDLSAEDSIWKFFGS